MSVKLTSHEKSGVMIVAIGGKLMLGEGTAAFREKFRELMAGGSRQILLDMGGVTYLDSSGLGELVAAYSAVTDAGGEMKLLHLAKRAHDLLKLTKLCTVFETFEDEASAIESFLVTEPYVL